MFKNDIKHNIISALYLKLLTKIKFKVVNSIFSMLSNYLIQCIFKNLVEITKKPVINLKTEQYIYIKQYN